jgi:predicted ABC-type ATPase
VVVDSLSERKEMTLIREYIRAILLESICAFPKAVFMAGGPGSGKSTVIRELGLADDLKIINPDDAYEESLKAAGIPLDRNTMFTNYKALKEKYTQAEAAGDLELLAELEPEYLALRAIMSKNMKLFNAARTAAKKTQEEYTCANDNFLVDGTGGNARQIMKQVRELRSLGYDVAMVFVDVPLETSVSRNRQRGQQGGRELADSTVEKSWSAVNRNKEIYADFFGDNFFYIDASDDMFDDSLEEARPAVSQFLSRG